MALVTALAGPVAAAVSDPTALPSTLPGQSVRLEALTDLTRRLPPVLAEERFEDALSIAKAIAAHPDFPNANNQVRLATLYLVGILNLQLDRPGAAVAPLVTATGMTGATTDHWHARLDAEGRSGDQVAAARSLSQMLRQFPDELEKTNPTYLLQRATDPNLDATAGFELRATLLAVNWHHPAESTVWMKHIDELLGRGETDRAGTLVDRITAPTAVVQLHALHRYDRLTADLPPLDIDAVLAADLAGARIKAAAPDADMAAHSTLANALFVRAHLDEALETADAALALPEPEVASKAARDRTWIMDTRARALMALGRYDDAVAQMQIAAARTEEGGVNVSQTINLAWLYLHQGRDAEALELMSAFDRSTAAPFGVMQAVQVQACAATALGDSAVAETAYAYLASHWRDAPQAAMDARLCRGDVDGAAALMVQRLDDPELAAAALSELHEYLPNPAPTPFDARLAAGAEAIAARPEVIAARDRVGRTFRIPTLRGQF